MPNFPDTEFILTGTADITRQVRFDASALAPGLAIITLPAAGTAAFLDAAQEFTSPNSFTGGFAVYDANGVIFGPSALLNYVLKGANADALAIELIVPGGIVSAATFAMLELAQTFTKAQTISPDSDVVPLRIVVPSGAIANALEVYNVDAVANVAYIDASGGLSASYLNLISGAYLGAFQATLTAARTYTMPDVTGTVCLIAATQTLTNKTITRLKTATTVSGIPVVAGDNTGASTANLMTRVNLTAQAAAIAATNITDTCPAGMYRVSYYLETTTANVTDGTIAFQVNYTDRVGATNQATAGTLSLAATTTGTLALKGEFTLYLASGNITYQTNLTGAQTTSRYAVTARAEYLG